MKNIIIITMIMVLVGCSMKTHLQAVAMDNPIGNTYKWLTYMNKSYEEREVFKKILGINYEFSKKNNSKVWNVLNTNAYIYDYTLDVYFNNSTNLPSNYTINGRYRIEAFNGKKLLYSNEVSLKTDYQYKKNGIYQVINNRIDILPAYIFRYKTIDIKLSVIEACTNTLYFSHHENHLTNNIIQISPNIRL